MVGGVGMLPQGLPTAKRPRVALDEVTLEKHHHRQPHHLYVCLNQQKMVSYNSDVVIRLEVKAPNLVKALKVFV